MINMPIKQLNHNYIDRAIIPWIDLHFPADPAIYTYEGQARHGRVFLGFHREDFESAATADTALPELSGLLTDVKDSGTEDEVEASGDQEETDGRPYHNGLWNLSRPDILELRTFIPQMHISPRLDYYIMANSVSGVARRNADVFALHNFVIDIDCHGSEKSPAELTQALDWYLKRDLWYADVGEDTVPRPNSIVKTGRGMQLWWAINPLPVKQAWKYLLIVGWLMDRIQEVIDEYAEELEGVSIDRGASKRLAGWFRLPLTYNTKAKRKGSLEILYSERYEHHELYTKYIPKRYKPSDERMQRRKGAEKPAFVMTQAADRKVFAGGTSNMALRVTQLCQLRALRQAAGNTDEMRDRFCLAVYSALLADYESGEAWARLLRFNDGFLAPMDKHKLAQNMRTASEIGGYRLSNQWVIDELEITEAEQDAIGLHPKGSEKAKKKRNHTRDLLRSLAKSARDNRILELWSDGRRKADIARELEIGRNTVTRVIKAYEADLAAQAEVDEALLAMEQAELQAAAGAEELTGAKNNGGDTCTKTGRINYASYPLPRSGGPGGHQLKLPGWHDPPGNRGST